ncbi:nuclear transport factor 2 family protein [Euzebya sp.]|uniref:nuclear transport factor 2 family protein n=1 Tax=Euzebya sp. TaxID=1971409 RepID=UPI00351719C4
MAQTPGAPSPAPDDLAGQVRWLVDRAELQDLVAAYAMAVDDRDWDAVGEMYAEDSVFQGSLGPNRGRDAVVAYYRERTEQFGATYHYPHSQVVTFTGPDTASGTVAAHAELAIGDETVVIALRYADAYVREGGRWRFRERTVQQLYAMPLSELPSGLAQPDRKRWPGTDPAPADLPDVPGVPR